MTLAIMQPYFVPYPGYFQLMAAVDKFVVFDDVAFITRGWINRNQILLNGREHRFTLPLQRASQNRLLNEIEFLADKPWRESLLKTFRQAYRRAPFFDGVFPLLQQIVGCEEQNLAAYLLNSLRLIKEHLGLQAELVPSSTVYGNAELKGEARILDICRQEKARNYLNAPGGRELYDAGEFARRGIELSFLTLDSLGGEYWDEESARLSIVHALMFHPADELGAALGRVTAIS